MASARAPGSRREASESSGAPSRAGSPPEFIYAFDKTGRLVTEMNLHLLAEHEIQEWTNAVEEYRRLHPAD